MMEKSILYVFFLPSKLGSVSVTTLIITKTDTICTKSKAFPRHCHYTELSDYDRANAHKNNATDPTEKILSNFMVIKNLAVTAVPQIKQYSPSLMANWSTDDRCAASRQAKYFVHGVTNRLLTFKKDVAV